MIFKDEGGGLVLIFLSVSEMAWCLVRKTKLNLKNTICHKKNILLLRKIFKKDVYKLILISVIRRFEILKDV